MTHTIFTLIIGICMGMQVKHILISSLPKYQAKYQVGTCLTDGLIYEKVVDVRFANNLQQRVYVLEAAYNKKNRLPTTNVPTWVVESQSQVTKAANCNWK